MKFINENPIIFIFLTTLISILFTYIIEKIFMNTKKEDITEESSNTIVTEEEEAKRKPPAVSYNDLKNILDETINRELYFWLQLTVNMKDVKIIDFAETVNDLSRRINGAFSKEFISDLSYFHDERWIMRYIVRTVKIYVTDYIRKHPIS